MSPSSFTEAAFRSEAPLRELLDELLDAHLDTLMLARNLSDTEAWACHCAYLGDLQRAAGEMLARLEASDSLPSLPLA